MLAGGIVVLAAVLLVCSMLIVSKAGQKDGICKYDQEEK